jgi:hypothetical protein
LFDTTKQPGSLKEEIPEGGIAQLGERLHGMQEVSGSIPLTSTTNFGWLADTVATVARAGR